MNNKVIFISGTPCTGKTTISEELFNQLNKNKNFLVKLVKINDLAISNDLILGVDSDKGYKVVDIEKLDKTLNIIIKNFFNENDNLTKIIIVEGHLSHLCSNPDEVIILRVNPKVLKGRLEKRDYKLSKIDENLEAESLGVCSCEAFEKHGDIVNEIDVTELSISEIVNNVKSIINHENKYPVGDVDFISWILDNG